MKNLKNKILFYLILLVMCITYLGIRDYSNFNLLEDDSWIHLAKTIKYLNDESPFFSPLFQEDFNHYAPFSYFFSNYVSVFLAIYSGTVYSTNGLLIFILGPLFIYIYSKRCFGSQFTPFIALIPIFLTSSLRTEFNSNAFSAVMIYGFIFLTTFKKIPKALSIIFAITVFSSHYLFATILIAYMVFFIVFYYLRKKINFIFEFPKKLNIDYYLFSYALLLFSMNFITVRGFTSSEISINIRDYYGLLGLGFLPIILSSVQASSFNTVIALLALYISTLLLYYFGISFHSHYYSDFFVSMVLLPGSFLFIYKVIFHKTHFFPRFILFILLCLPLVNLVPVMTENTKSRQQFRINLTSELMPYRDMLKYKVLFIDPGSYLNRFVVVDIPSYIYSANSGGITVTSNTLPKPFTTLPGKLNSYPSLFHQLDRVNKARAFFINPNDYTYQELGAYRIDFFIIPISKATIPESSSQEVNEFLSSRLVTIAKTKSYFIYKNQD